MSPTHVSYVEDRAHFFTDDKIERLNETISKVAQSTGRFVEVYTTDNLTAPETPRSLGEKIFEELHVRGVLLIVVRSPKVLGVVPDRGVRGYFSSARTTDIRKAMATKIQQRDFDGGITDAVQMTIDFLRAERRAPSPHRFSGPAR